MMTKPLLSAAMALCCLALGACAQRSESPADSVVLNASIYTADGSNPAATALVVKGAELVYVGSDAGAREYIGEHTVVEDLQEELDAQVCAESAAPPHREP